MHVYFVRHGRTQLNDKHIHQSPSTPLSPKGREEVLSVAESLRAVSPDLLLTSEYTRALETARIIGSRVGLTPVMNGLFYEIERPSHLFATSIYHPKTFWYLLQTFLHRNNPSWRYRDAENFSDMKKRAEKALLYLESLKDTHTSVVVVSHTVFLHMLISYMCRHRMLDMRDLVRVLFESERMHNGGIVHAEYIGEGHGQVCRWQIIEQ